MNTFSNNLGESQTMKNQKEVIQPNKKWAKCFNEWFIKDMWIVINT